MFLWFFYHPVPPRQIVALRSKLKAKSPAVKRGFFFLVRIEIVRKRKSRL
jgi:hypothetical protein